MYSSETSCFQVSSSQAWYYDYRHLNEGKLWRVKSSKDDFTASLTYFKVKCLGSGISGVVCLYQPEQMGTCKAIKFSNGNHHPVKSEYEISLKWPKGETGLLLRPKAYFREPFRDFYIMHRYTSNIVNNISLFTISEKIESIYQLCQGVTTLHNLGIAHRDIHLANVFYDRDKNRFDLGDFGRAITLETNKEKFDLGVSKDIQNLKEAIESILIGEEVEPFARIIDGYRQRLNTLEDILKLGFSLKSSWLILDFMHRTPRNTQEILGDFTKIKERLN
ncbi:MAG: hypothetical protein CK425_08945 [Parachlamydia sp.]|nr:MAG: hypothetical protein CK425_08945 [Parachlamydia sp.]